jgi:hypothetical protein
MDLDLIQISNVLQIVVALGLLNVWIVRLRKSTIYRGGMSLNLRDEFAEYGLPDALFWIVGVLKITIAILLIAGIWHRHLLMPTSAVLFVLMVGALAMHVKIGDPPIKSLPAFLMLAMTGAIFFLSLL